MSKGGQTVTFGKEISVIGNVSKVVVTGLSDQLSKLCFIMPNAVKNPAMTTHTQNALAYFLVVEIYTRPCIVEDSKNVLTPSMVVEALIVVNSVFKIFVSMCPGFETIN